MSVKTVNFSSFVLRFSRIFFAIFCFFFFFIFELFAAGYSSNDQSQSILKADEVSGDRVSNFLFATGNVELSRNSGIVYADKVFYDKNTGWIRAFGNVRLKNIELGNLVASNAKMKEDFNVGLFFDATMVFNDGSYFSSPRVDRKTSQITVMENAIYSFCPNPEISQDNESAGKFRDFISIKSKTLTIDREQNVVKVKGGVVRLYNVPFFYTPVFQAAIPGKERKTGFLYPTYSKSTRFGVGIKIPFYWNIAENKDLLTTTQFNPAHKQYIVDNQFRHLTSYGEYKLGFEFANNNAPRNGSIIQSTKSKEQYRWAFDGDGKFDFTHNTGLDFTSERLSDPNYLRDYHTIYQNYTISKVNLDYINGRSYHAIKAINIQELENQNKEVVVFPKIDSHIESKPLSFGQKIALTSNFSAVKNENGTYRRLTAIPEFNLPFKVQGNLFNLKAKVQSDFYSLSNFYNQNQDQVAVKQYLSNTNRANAVNSTSYQNFQRGTYFEGNQSAYKPEVSLSWSLPFMKKTEKQTIVIEPIANIVSSYYSKSAYSLPNIDSNSSQLSITNLFVNDHVSGFDRNEVGQRVNYGVRSSWFNSAGEVGFNIGQSQKLKEQNQDIVMGGFNSRNMSSVVGEAFYRAKKHFSIFYNFQLNQTNYRNDINDVTTNLNFDDFGFSSNYLLMRRNNENPNRIEQITFSSRYKLNHRLEFVTSATRNLVTGRNVTRSVGVNYDGCCTVLGFLVTENNPSNLVRKQRNFSIILKFKNL